LFVTAFLNGWEKNLTQRIERYPINKFEPTIIPEEQAKK